MKTAEQTNNNSQIKDQMFDDESLTPQSSEFFEENNILTETEALFEFPAIPLYFPTSYSLVKPYILGFETNNLDAPSLKNVRIDNNWQPKKSKSES